MKTSSKTTPAAARRTVKTAARALHCALTTLATRVVVANGRGHLFSDEVNALVEHFKACQRLLDRIETGTGNLGTWCTLLNAHADGAWAFVHVYFDAAGPGTPIRELDAALRDLIEHTREFEDVVAERATLLVRAPRKVAVVSAAADRRR